MDEAKPFWASKTMWVNALLVVFSIVNGQAGWLELSGEDSAAILGVVNLVLRAVTKGSVTLS